MAAPSPTARSTPVGRKAPDGYRTTITFSKFLTVALWEKDVKPPGVDGGEPIDTTTMLNDLWHTMAPRSLKKLEPVTANYAYDPDDYPTIISMTNEEQTITVRMPNGGTICFYGYLQKATPGDNKDGEQPMLAATIIPTLEDPTTRVEQGPVYTPAAGT